MSQLCKTNPISATPQTSATLSTACHSDRRHACGVPKRRNLLQHSHCLPSPLLRPVCHAITTCIMQNKPNSPKTKMTLNLCPEKHYAKACLLRHWQNKPNQTQFPRHPIPIFRPKTSPLYEPCAPVPLCTPVSCPPFPPSGRRKPGDYCEAFAVFFPVFALFFPRISSACSGVSGGHLPAD